MYQVRVSEGGRVVVPAALRRKYGIRVGDTLVWRDGEHGLVPQSRTAGIRRAQAIAAKVKKPRVSVADERIRERRADAARA
jgi:AbrB family looped-hinge helix DNA binding protein